MKQEIIKIFENKFLEKYPDKNSNNHQYYYVMRMLEEALHEGLVGDAKNEIAGHGNNPLLTLMHDTAHDLDSLRLNCKNLDDYFKEKKPHDANPYLYTEYIRAAWKSIRDQLDEFYIKHKGGKIKSNAKV